MASPLRIPDEAAVELETAKESVLAYVTHAESPVSPSDLFAAVRQRSGVPVSLAQLAMWELLSYKAIEFTKDYRLTLPR